MIENAILFSAAFRFIEFAPEIENNHSLRDSIPTAVDQDFINSHGWNHWRGSSCLGMNYLNTAIIELTTFGDFDRRGIEFRDSSLRRLQIG